MKFKKTKQLILLVAILLGVITGKGQDNLVIHLVDNSDVTLAINGIQRITFSDDNMLLKPVTGADRTYLLDNIAFVTFSNGDISIHENHGVDKNLEVKVYQNSSGELVVESSCPVTGLTVFDLNGRVVTMTARSHVNVNHLSMGIYFLKIETSEGIVTKKFAKTR